MQIGNAKIDPAIHGFYMKNSLASAGMFLNISPHPALNVSKNSETYYDNNNPDNEIVIQEKWCLVFCEACNGSSFYFINTLIKNLLVKTVFVRYYLKLSLPMLLECFLIFA